MIYRSGLIFILSTFFITIFADSITRVSENNEAYFYVLEDSIIKRGGNVEFLQITDFKNPRANQKGESYQSMEYRAVVDCVSSTQTMTFIKVYSGSMASGTLIDSGRMNQKNPIPPGTSLELIKNFVCN
jgi:hypothetical protein